MNDRDSKLQRLEGLFKELLEVIGENPTREGLVKTPSRAARAFLDFTLGY